MSVCKLIYEVDYVSVYIGEKKKIWNKINAIELHLVSTQFLQVTSVCQ